MGEYTDSEGFTVSSNQSEEGIRQALGVEEKPDKGEKGEGSEKGEKGEKTTIKPIPPAKTEKGGEKPPVEEPASAEEDEDNEDGKEDGKNRSGDPRRNPTARMLRATKEAAELRRSLEAERAEKAEIKERLAGLERIARQYSGDPGDGQKPRDPRIPPNPDEYEDVHEYNAAQAEWIFNRKMEERDRQAAYAKQVEDHIKDIGGKIDKFKASYDAFPDRERISEVVSSLTPSIFAEGEKTAENGLADALILAEDPGPIMVYLSEHEDVLQKILDIPKGPGCQAAIDRHITRIETLLELENSKAEREEDEEGGEEAPASRPRPKRVSTAKPPIKPLPTRTGKSDDDDLENMPFERYFDVMNKRDAEKRKRGL
jgi:hypothetical protein